MVNLILVLFVAICAVLAVVFCSMLLMVGTKIDGYGEKINTNKKRRGNPKNATRIAVKIYSALFVVGAGMVLLPIREVIIVGIAIQAGLIIFGFISLAISFSAIREIEKREKDGYYDLKSDLINLIFHISA